MLFTRSTSETLLFWISTRRKNHVKYLVAYKIVEYDPLLDSSNMCVKDWIRVGKDVAVRRYHSISHPFHYQHNVFGFQSNYHLYDGFVILHGTDTMAYTASALSFMFEGLGKAVIITGSQVNTNKSLQQDFQLTLPDPNLRASQRRQG